MGMAAVSRVLLLSPLLMWKPATSISLSVLQVLITPITNLLSEVNRRIINPPDGVQHCAFRYAYTIAESRNST